MKTVCLPVTMMQENVYFFYDETTKDGIVVDPGGEPKRLCEFITANGLNIKGILLTHGHFDHVQAVDDLKKLTGAPVVAHVDEAAVLRSTRLNMSPMIRRNIEIEADILLEDGDVFEFGGHSLKALHTPGHTVGGLSYYSEESGLVFSGDTLFYDSIGRSDFEGGDYNLLLSSIKNKLFALPDDTAVYPGHGGDTTILYEKKHNPFVKVL